MLREDQVVELLTRCEALIGRRLDELRGNLRVAASRSAAIWELVCIDALGAVGPVEYEPLGNSSPDVVLTLPETTPLWIEATFLYADDWESERRSRDVSAWIYSEAERRGIAAHKISLHFSAALGTTPSKPILPAQHVRKPFMKSSPVAAFFAQIESKPSSSFSLQLDPYSIRLQYDPLAPGPYLHSSGPGSALPRTPAEHPLYRKLLSKSGQHDPHVPYVICVGSDQHFAISHQGQFGTVSMSDAIAEAFRQHGRISAVLVVAIQTPLAYDQGHVRKAASRLYENANATRPLQSKHRTALQCADFNRWQYHFQLDRWDIDDVSHHKRATGSLGLQSGKGGHVTLKISERVLVDCLAGRTTLREAFGIKAKDEFLIKCVEEGWTVVGVGFEAPSIEQGVPGAVTLEFAPPHESVMFKK